MSRCHFHAWRFVRRRAGDHGWHRLWRCAACGRERRSEQQVVGRSTSLEAARARQQASARRRAQADTDQWYDDCLWGT